LSLLPSSSFHLASWLLQTRPPNAGDPGYIEVEIPRYDIDEYCTGFGLEGNGDCLWELKMMFLAIKRRD